MSSKDERYKDLGIDTEKSIDDVDISIQNRVSEDTLDELKNNNRQRRNIYKQNMDLFIKIHTSTFKITTTLILQTQKSAIKFFTPF